MDDEAGKCILWQILTALLAVTVLILTMPLALPLTYLAERGVSLTTTSWVGGYAETFFSQFDYWIGVHKLRFPDLDRV